MSVYELGPDEAVIMRASDVTTAGSMSHVDLILTNKYLIQINKGLFGGDKEAEKYPLSELRVLNGKANVLVGKDRNNKRLELYYYGFEKIYSFSGLFTEDKWASAVIKAHKAYMEECNKKQKREVGQTGLFKSLAETLDTAKEKILPRSPAVKSGKCPRCGAILSGQNGKKAICVYCNETVEIK